MIAALVAVRQNGPLYVAYAPAWVPNDGDLLLFFATGLPIGSLYLPKVDVPISVNAEPVPPNGNPFYTATPPAEGNNPQTIPVPPGTTQVSLSASSAETYYVVVTSGRARLLMEGSSST